MNILNKIIRHKKNEISHLKLNYSTSQLESSLFFERETISLKSKLKSLLRRIEVNDSEVINLKNLTIDRNSYKVTIDNKEITLPRKEFELLFLLASSCGKVYKREHILESVWGKDVVVGDRTIDVHIRKLREKIGSSYLKTIKGVGYKLNI